MGGDPQLDQASKTLALIKDVIGFDDSDEEITSSMRESTPNTGEEDRARQIVGAENAPLVFSNSNFDSKNLFAYSANEIPGDAIIID